MAPRGVRVTGEGVLARPAELAVLTISIQVEKMNSKEESFSAVRLSRSALIGLIHQNFIADERTGRGRLDSPVADYSVKPCVASLHSDFQFDGLIHPV